MELLSYMQMYKPSNEFWVLAFLLCAIFMLSLARTIYLMEKYEKKRFVQIIGWIVSIIGWIFFSCCVIIYWLYYYGDFPKD